MLPISTNHTIGTPFIELISVDSTNNYAMGQLRKNAAAHGTVFFAYEQTCGKGTQGKRWYSEKGANIAISAILDTSAFDIGKQSLFSMALAVAVHSFVNKYVLSETFIKWPNDIYWRDRKAAGILVENIVAGNKWQWAVAGIGININQTNFDEGLLNPVSLKQICGKSFQPILLAKDLCTFLQTAYENMMPGRYPEILSLYNQSLYRREQITKLKKGNIVFETTVIGVNESGELCTDNPGYQNFISGEIEWVI